MGWPIAHLNVLRVKALTSWAAKQAVRSLASTAHPVRLSRHVPTRAIAATVLCLVCVGCRGWRGNTYYGARFPPSEARKETTYRFGSPDGAWRPLRKVKDVQVAWVNADLGAVIEIHGQCDEQGDSSLHEYTDHLRIDWTDWEIESQTEETLVGRAALRTVVTAKLDGVPRKGEFLVAKKSGCLFDLRVVSRPDAFTSARSAFSQVVAGFQFPPGES
jgi:hypothetical protein